MKVLITGGSGLVGSALLELLGTRNDVKVHSASRTAPAIKAPFTHHPSNFTQPAMIDALASLDPDTVIHTAAETNVDLCEDQPDRAKAIHEDATRRLISLFPRAKFVYLSTDYVFDGKSGPYSETDIPNPLGVYAKTKYAAEQLFRPDDLIIRTTIIWGHHPRKNFVNWLVGELGQGKPVRVVDDQLGSPTYAKHLAQAIMHLMPAHHGIYNVVGHDIISRYDFAVKIARQLALNERLITPVPTSELKQKAPRPLNAGLKIDKLLATGFAMPSLEDALEDFVENSRKF